MQHKFSKELRRRNILVTWNHNQEAAQFSYQGENSININQYLKTYMQITNSSNIYLGIYIIDKKWGKNTKQIFEEQQKP